MKLIKTISVTASMLFAATAFAGKPTISDLEITKFEYSCDTGQIDATAEWIPSGNSGKGIMVAYQVYTYDEVTQEPVEDVLFQLVATKMNEGISILDVVNTSVYEPPFQLQVWLEDKKENRIPDEGHPGAEPWIVGACETTSQ